MIFRNLGKSLCSGARVRNFYNFFGGWETVIDINIRDILELLHIADPLESIPLIKLEKIKGTD